MFFCYFSIYHYVGPDGSDDISSASRREQPLTLPLGRASKTTSSLEIQSVPSLVLEASVSQSPTRDIVTECAVRVSQAEEIRTNLDVTFKNLPDLKSTVCSCLF